MQHPRARRLPRPLINPFDPDPLSHGFILPTAVNTPSSPLPRTVTNLTSQDRASPTCKMLPHVQTESTSGASVFHSKQLLVKDEPVEEKMSVATEPILASRVAINPKVRRNTFAIAITLVATIFVVVGWTFESYRLAALLQDRTRRWSWHLYNLAWKSSWQANPIMEKLERRIVDIYGWWRNLGLLNHTALIIAELWSRVDTLEASLSSLARTLDQGETPLLANYALLAVGATVELSMTSVSSGVIEGWGPWRRVVEQTDPSIVLRNGLEVGNCWKFEGSSGQIGIWLSQRIRVTHLTFEYPPISLLHNKESIPRDFSLWVKHSDHRRFYEPFLPAASMAGPPHPLGPWKMILAGTFTFQPSDSVPQLFAVPSEVADSWLHESFGTDGIVIQFLTNWGDPKGTCIYGIRIHGVPFMY